MRLEAKDQYPTWVLAAALAGMFATTFPITILAVALGPIANEFGEKETTIAWVISAPMLLSAVAFPLVGKRYHLAPTGAEDGSESRSAQSRNATLRADASPEPQGFE